MPHRNKESVFHLRAGKRRAKHLNAAGQGAIQNAGRAGGHGQHDVKEKVGGDGRAIQNAAQQNAKHKDAGEPAQPVHISLITAKMCGLRLRFVFVPEERGSSFTTWPARYSSIVGCV